jgi:formate hydrogenlyase subunit 3/multisubunit Na+/H+ antiporter MnhD subunit
VRRAFAYYVVIGGRAMIVGARPRTDRHRASSSTRCRRAPAESAARRIAVVVAFAAFFAIAFGYRCAGRVAAVALASVHRELPRRLRPDLVLDRAAADAAVTFSALLVARAAARARVHAQMLVLQGAMTGVFLAKDLLLFALFWDLMLIPVFLLMLGWGCRRAARVRAARRGAI